MPKPKYVSTLELVTHVYHDRQDGNDIRIEDVIEGLQNAIADIKSSGSFGAWMEVIYTEET